MREARASAAAFRVARVVPAASAVPVSPAVLGSVAAFPADPAVLGAAAFAEATLVAKMAMKDSLRVAASGLVEAAAAFPAVEAAAVWAKASRGGGQADPVASPGNPVV